MKNFLFRILFVIIALVGGATDLFADEVKFNYGDYLGQGAVTNGYPYEMKKKYVSISDSKFYGNNKYVSFYSGGTTTITPADGTTIIKIVYNVTDVKYNGFENDGRYNSSVGKVTKIEEKVVEWKGSASTSFTIAHSELIRWTSIVVTYEQNNSGTTDDTEHTASFSINGAIDEANDCKVAEGNPITFPSIPSVHGYTFKGWANNEIAGTQITAPKLIDPNQEKMGAGNVTYYAVFASNDNTRLEQLNGNTSLKDGDRIAAFIECDKKYYGLYQAEAESEGFIESYVLATSPTPSDIVADPKRSWTITSAGNNTWYLGDASFGYLYNQEGSDNVSLCNDYKTSFSIEWETNTFHIRHGVNYRWLSCYSGSSDENQFKFQVTGTNLAPKKGTNYQFQIFRLTSSYCTTIPSSTITFAATDGQDYYATFCNYNAVAFPKTLSDGRKISVEAVSVANGIIDKKDIAAVFSCVKDYKVVVPANTGVLLHVEGATEAPTVPYSIFTEEVPGQMEELKTFNMLIPCLTTGMCPSAEGDNKYYRLAYGDYSAKTNLGFWWGHEGGTNDFNVKAGGAVLCVPNSAGSNIQGFGFNDPGTLTIVGCRADESNTNIIYNLRGQRIGSQKNGVIIDKGRKVIR